MNASQACGGVDAAAEHVEWAARYGIGHMKPTNFKQLGNYCADVERVLKRIV